MNVKEFARYEKERRKVNIHDKGDVSYNRRKRGTS